LKSMTVSELRSSSTLRFPASGTTGRVDGRRPRRAPAGLDQGRPVAPLFGVGYEAAWRCWNGSAGSHRDSERLLVTGSQLISSFAVAGTCRGADTLCSYRKGAGVCALYSQVRILVRREDVPCFSTISSSWAHAMRDCRAQYHFREAAVRIGIVGANRSAARWARRRCRRTRGADRQLALRRDAERRRGRHPRRRPVQRMWCTSRVCSS
jgi:hypothetical protein